MTDTAPIRLQVFLSHSGVCSRRKAMDLIQEGHVTVNGQLQKEPSTKVDPQVDKVAVDGKPVESKSYSYILLNKPRDYVCTTAAFEKEKSVLELLPQQFHHLVPVGRLDKDTEGLLLLTNDGDLAYRLTHPKFNVDKTYFVCVYGILQNDERRKLERGVDIPEEGTFVAPINDEGSGAEEGPASLNPKNMNTGKTYKTAPAKISEIKPYTDRTRTEFLLTLHEGKKRQIRLMCEAIGHKVAYLKRVAQGPLQLGDLPTGKWKELTALDVKKLSLPPVTARHEARSVRTDRPGSRPAAREHHADSQEARSDERKRKKSYFDRFKKIQKSRDRNKK